MRSVYVPFAISQPALLAGILYVASRRYSVMASSTGRYREKTLWYKFMCLQNATRGVTLEHFGSNATVALTLVLASEAVCINLSIITPSLIMALVLGRRPRSFSDPWKCPPQNGHHESKLMSRQGVGAFVTSHEYISLQPWVSACARPTARITQLTHNYHV